MKTRVKGNRDVRLCRANQGGTANEPSPLTMGVEAFFLPLKYSDLGGNSIEKIWR